MKQTKWVLSVALCFSTLSVVAETLPGEVPLQPSNMEVYGSVGLPGVAVGVGYGVNENVTVRADFTTAGRITHEYKQRGFQYKGELDADKVNLMADYFPMDNGFRVTAGLGLGRTEMNAVGHGRDGTQSVRIGGKTYSVNLDENDTAHARVRYPKVSPYLGIGWGHNVKTQEAGSWGFTADVGLYIGKPRTDIFLSDSLRTKIENSIVTNSGGTITAEAARAEVDSRLAREKDKIRDRLERYKVIPAVNVGVAYYF